MQPFQNCIGPTIRIGREILCLPYARFFGVRIAFRSSLNSSIVLFLNLKGSMFHLRVIYGKKLLEKYTPLKGNLIYVFTLSWLETLGLNISIHDFTKGRNVLQCILWNSVNPKKSALYLMLDHGTNILFHGTFKGEVAQFSIFWP